MQGYVDQWNYRHPMQFGSALSLRVDVETSRCRLFLRNTVGRQKSLHLTFRFNDAEIDTRFEGIPRKPTTVVVMPNHDHEWSLCIGDEVLTPI